jgi:NAD(P)-dependent dehydrogenase (short-subunit alcohol dehydrogenase family)
MSVTDVTRLLRPGLLDGVRIALAGAAEGKAPTAAAVRSACEELGGEVLELAGPVAGEPEVQEAHIDREVQEICAGGRPIDLLVIDAGAIHEAALAGGERAALAACLSASWSFTRAVANVAFIPASRGRVIYLAPGAGAEHAPAAASALENLARTLSIEWSRHRVTTVAIAPGLRTAAGEVAALSAYLASPAGAYFSGCLLDLRGPGS